MGRRRIEEPTSVPDALKQLDPYINEVERSKPRWGLQQKAHNQYTKEMKERETLKDGFAGFYAQPEPVGCRVGDTVRRRGNQPEYGKESEWKPCFRLVKYEVKPPRRYGKKALEPISAKSEDEIPRGKKHVPPPGGDQLGGEMELFQTKHRTLDEHGKAVAERVTDLSSTDPAKGTGRARIDTIEKRRNGIPMKTIGDKPVSAVEYSAEYAAAMSPAMPKLNYQRVIAPPVVVDQWAMRERVRQHDADIHAVRTLPDL